MALKSKKVRKPSSKKKSARKIRKGAKPLFKVRRINGLEDIRELKKPRRPREEKNKKGKGKKLKESQPEIEIKNPETGGFLESFPSATGRAAQVLESGQEQARPGAELEDVLAGVETPAATGKGEEKKEGAALYSGSEASYFTGGKEETTTAIGEEAVDTIVENLRERKVFVEKPTFFTAKKSPLEIDKTMSLGPVDMPEMHGGDSGEYMQRYVEPHHKKDSALPWVKKGEVDIKKYKRAK